MSHLSDQFLDAWNEHAPKSFPAPATEYRFHDTRRWRFDCCWPDLWIAVELQGFGWGHQRIVAIVKDYEKWRAAALLGWTVIPFSSACLSSKAKRRDAIEYLVNLMMQGSSNDIRNLSGEER